VVNEIRILDLVDTATSYEDGETVYQKLLEEIRAGHEVTVSFEGIGSVPSAFINAAFVKLLETHSFDEVRSLLKIKNSTRHINELVKSRFEFVSGSASTTRTDARTRPTSDSTYRGRDGRIYQVREVRSLPGIDPNGYEVVVAGEEDVRFGRSGQCLTDVEFGNLVAEQGLRLIG
jgi:hypothetical protein